MDPREFEIDLPHGRIACCEWGRATARPVLALHGWLDNAASFSRLAPLLLGVRVVAVDLPGHGRSDHFSAAVHRHFIDWPADVIAIANQLEWREFTLIGHSMGAGIASLTPAVFPERIERLVLIEGIGPLAASPDTAPEQLAKALADEVRVSSSRPRVFANLEAAIAARAEGTDLDPESARLLVERGTASGDGGVSFTFDQRLRARSRLRLTEEHVLAFLAGIECPVLAVRASHGWPFPEDEIERRLRAISDLVVSEIEGGHHVHLTHAERVAPLLNSFFASSV